MTRTILAAAVLAVLCLTGSRAENMNCGISASLTPYRISTGTGLVGFLDSIVTLNIWNSGDEVIVLDYWLIKKSVVAVGVEYPPGTALGGQNPDLAVHEERRKHVYSMCVLYPNESVSVHLLLSDFLPFDWQPNDELVIVSRYSPASDYPDFFGVTECNFESEVLSIPTNSIK